MFPLHDDNPLHRWPIFTLAIIAINVAVFLYQQGLSPAAQQDVALQYGFIPKRFAQLSQPNLVVEVKLEDPDLRNNKPRIVKFQPNRREVLFSLLSCMFLHGSWMHLIGNMWFFWLFGNNIEDRLGSVVFLLFYLIGGVIASLCHWAMVPVDEAGMPVIGASGAVSVMLGAYAVTYPTAKVKTLVFLFVIFFFIDLPALVVLGFWFLFQLLGGVEALQQGVGGDVALWAHIGGFLVGMICMPVLAAGTPEPKEDWTGEANRQFDYTRGVPDHYSRGVPGDRRF